ncbi:hypothetical protein BRC86_00220 [Halobacteriales archaeon QS_3_64_16]|nr:MAG: hypothetical protein BRC86_00220 [Halobacteriales archaeon QS_3_64_16]
MYEPPFWRDREANERLAATECDACGYVSFPERREVCKRCGERGEFRDTRLEERGIVQSYVIQNRLPDAFETPLPVAVMDVPQVGANDGGSDGDDAGSDAGEPARVYGLFTETDPEAMAIGMEAAAVFRELFDVEGLPVGSFKFTVPRGENR